MSNQFKVGGRRGHIFVDDAPDSFQRLASFLSLHRGQIIFPGAGVRFKHDERPRFLDKMLKKQNQHRMLKHFGVIAGVVFARLTERNGTY